MRATTCSDFESEHHLRFSECHLREEDANRFWAYVRRIYPAAKDFNIPLREAFSKAEQEVPSVSVQRGILGGNPCLSGTRIPVYMILDAIEHYGSLEGVLRSYPHLTLKQVRDAVRFSKVVLECCVEH